MLCMYNIKLQKVIDIIIDIDITGILNLTAQSLNLLNY